MSVPQKNFLRTLAVAMLLVIIGCASGSHPAPGLKDGKYTNDVYQYSAVIPPGWIAYQRAPEEIARLMGEDLTDATKLVLVNQSTGGIIAVLNLSDENHFDQFVNAPASTWERMPQALKENMGNKGEVIRFDYELQPENLAQTLRNHDASPLAFKPEKLLSAEIDMRYASGDSTSGIMWYLYPCQGRNTCQAIFLLSCNRDQYVTNHPAFETIVSSLTIHASAGK